MSGRMSGPQEVFAAAHPAGQMGLDGVWIHVGTPEAVAEAEAYLAKLPQ